jgi:subtilisin-like proprotein convertase family protein
MADLIVYLVSPEGVAVILHNLTTGVNLITTYPTLTVPVESLNNYINKSVQGNWTLFVSDVIAGQTGTINPWTLNIFLNNYNIPTTTLTRTLTTALTVNSLATTTSTFNINVSGRIVSVVVSVNCADMKQNELILTLISPTSTSVLLHNAGGGSANDLIATYPLATLPTQSLNAFMNSNPIGNWGLQIRNLANKDLTVNSWSLRIIYSA